LDAGGEGSANPGPRADADTALEHC
jgi:hypothetical protein